MITGKGICENRALNIDLTLRNQAKNLDHAESWKTWNALALNYCTRHGFSDVFILQTVTCYQKIGLMQKNKQEINLKVNIHQNKHHQPMVSLWTSLGTQKWKCEYPCEAYPSMEMESIPNINTA